MARTTSGRVTFRISLQPSSWSKSSSVRSYDCSIVPIAPSPMTTRRDSSLRRSDTPARIVRDRARRARFSVGGGVYSVDMGEYRFERAR